MGAIASMATVVLAGATTEIDLIPHNLSVGAIICLIFIRFSDTVSVASCATRLYDG